MTKHNQNLQKILEPFKLYQFDVKELLDFFIFLEAHMDYIESAIYTSRTSEAAETARTIEKIAKDGIDLCEELMRSR